MGGTPLSPLLEEDVKLELRMYAELAKHLGIERPGHAGVYAYFRGKGLGHQEAKDATARLVRAASARFNKVVMYP